jgi:hypothetical protein
MRLSANQPQRRYASVMFIVVRSPGCSGVVSAGTSCEIKRISRSVVISYRFQVNVPIAFSATGGFPLRADKRYRAARLGLYGSAASDSSASERIGALDHVLRERKPTYLDDWMEEPHLGSKSVKCRLCSRTVPPKPGRHILSILES